MAPQQLPFGSLAAPYQPTIKIDRLKSDNIDQAIVTLHSISAIPHYENKSFEELRLEDYFGGNRGTSSKNSAYPRLFALSSNPQGLINKSVANQGNQRVFYKARRPWRADKQHRNNSEPHNNETTSFHQDQGAALHTGRPVNQVTYANPVNGGGTTKTFSFNCRSNST